VNVDAIKLAWRRDVRIRNRDLATIGHGASVVGQGNQTALKMSVLNHGVYVRPIATGLKVKLNPAGKLVVRSHQQRRLMMIWSG